MNVNDQYEAWRAKRSAEDVDEQFADRVMDRIEQLGTTRLPVRQHESAGWWRPSLVAALLATSFFLGLLRFGSVIGLVLLSCAEAKGF